MADEDKDQKTEEATPKKRQEARSEGQVAQSQEFIAAVMLLAMIGAFLTLGSGLADHLGGLVAASAQRMSDLALDDLGPGQFAEILRMSVGDVSIALAALAAPTILVGFLVSYGQVGVQLTPKALKVDLNKLNPVSGFKKIFGPRGAVRTALGVLKIVAIGTAVGVVTWRSVPRISMAAGGDAISVVVALGHTLLRAAVAGVVVFLLISLIDLIYQKYQHGKDLRMSKKEIKDEHKNAEGDPQVKARIRQVQREVASRRMMDDVPDATVVVMNPTHYAVALRYEDGSDAAPRVVAKGLDLVALRIRDVADAAGVMVVEEPPLARALHRSCEIGDPVPEDLFEAVAKLLAYVYRVQGKSVGERRGRPAEAAR